MVYAKKSLGQHFLKSERAIGRIIEAGEIVPGETVLEIGPGTGTLTAKLLQAGAKVLAVEKDDILFEQLKSELRDENLELVHDDILKFIENSKLKIGNYKLISNIPYNITGAILEKFLSAEHQPERMVLLVQDEVAKRIVARDNKESILSISVKAYGTPRYVEKVLAGSFVPPPKVNSAIIAIEGISKAFFSGFTEESFFRAVKAGFSSKRKKLSSNLANAFGQERVARAFAATGLDPNIRAEDVSLDKWGELVRYLV